MKNQEENNEETEEDFNKADTEENIEETDFNKAD